MKPLHIQVRQSRAFALLLREASPGYTVNNAVLALRKSGMMDADAVALALTLALTTAKRYKSGCRIGSSTDRVTVQPDGQVNRGL